MPWCTFKLFVLSTLFVPTTFCPCVHAVCCWHMLYFHVLNRVNDAVFLLLAVSAICAWLFRRFSYGMGTPCSSWHHACHCRQCSACTQVRCSTSFFLPFSRFVLHSVTLTSFSKYFVLCVNLLDRTSSCLSSSICLRAIPHCFLLFPPPSSDFVFLNKLMPVCFVSSSFDSLCCFGCFPAFFCLHTEVFVINVRINRHFWSYIEDSSHGVMHHQPQKHHTELAPW